MAQLGIYVKKTKISDICGGKIDFQMRVRVINLWATPDRTNPADDGAIHMILLDGACDTIQATIRKDLISQFKSQIEEGCAYDFERFMVAKNDATFKTTPHKHKLNFMRGTKVYKIKADEIPRNQFVFMPFQDILACTAEDRFLDVIGHVVERNDLKETEKNGKISKVMDATLEDLEGNRIHCTLWDDFALSMQRYLDAHNSSLPVIVILQLCKLKKYLGVMGISNSFHGTKLFLNADVPEVASYVDRMNTGNVELTQVVSQLTGPTMISLVDDLLQTQRMTIEDLIESTEKCYGSVLAWTCEFDTDAGWFYQACTKCASRINFMGGQLYCDKCKMPRTAIPRFKVNLQVIDNTGSITFVMFDRVVSQVLGKSAQDLLDAMNKDHVKNGYPAELDVFVNKRMLFKIEVTDANLYRNWRNYTVKKVTGDEDIINRFMALHRVNLNIDSDGEKSDNFTCNLADDSPLTLTEGGDSTAENGDKLGTDVMQTPTSKLGRKKSICSEGVGSSATKKLVIVDDELDTAVATEANAAKLVGKRSTDLAEDIVLIQKETKIACVKIEKTE